MYFRQGKPQVGVRVKQNLLARPLPEMADFHGAEINGGIRALGLFQAGAVGGKMGNLTVEKSDQRSE